MAVTLNKLKLFDKLLERICYIMVRRLGESSKRRNEKSGNVTLFKDGLWKFSGGFDGLVSALLGIFGKDEAAMDACIEYCNSFGDPLIEEPFISPRDVADTTAQVIEAEYNDASDADDFAVYIGDFRNGVNIEILDANYRRAKSFESKNTKRSGRKLQEDNSSFDGYAVEIHDMGKGYIHLALFNDMNDAESAYDMLKNIESFSDDEGYESDEEYTLDIESALQLSDEIINEVDWRKEIDGDIWTAGDGTIYKIVGRVSLYLYW